MSEKPLKIVSAPEAKTRPEHPAAEAPHRARRKRLNRKQLRTVLLIAVPAIAAVLGGAVYFMGGRYISTDNAYVGAQKVLITPDISGKITHVAVVEGQHVKPGDELFTLDAQPYKLVLDGAKGKLDAARSNYDKLQTNLKSLATLANLAQKNVDIKQRDLDRKLKLAASQAGSPADVDTAAAAMVTAQLQAEFTKQQRDSTLNQLLGKADLPLAEFPEYAQAKAALDDAQRNLDLTTVRAPMNGVATQVEQIQLGRFVMAGAPVFSIIDVANPWVDANPKESDFTYVAVGQSVTLDVDAFPNHVFKGTVGSLSPGTGAQFAILPPQNATGNFVKVVQRVPVRIYFDKNDRFVRKLKAGMSVYATIDTNHRRSLAALFGFSPAAANHEQD